MTPAAGERALFSGIIQIAGVMDLAEARMLLDEGVDRLGLPLRLTVHPEDLTEEEAAEVVRALPSPPPVILITYLIEADEILALCDKLSVCMVQVHAPLSSVEARRLREAAPDFLLMKSLVIAEDNAEEVERTVIELSPHVDAFITDTYDPATGACGATGKTHDWGVSRTVVEMSPRPVILAGGLNPGNVRRAILDVRPAGVDAHTGVEGADGRKDRERVRAFVQEARQGFAEAARLRA